MSTVVFITLRPDDYHGSPEWDSVFPPDPFPSIPDRNYIFDLWSKAGYNSWSMGDFETEEEAFEQYGDSPIYYAVYLLILENKKVLEDLRSELQEFWDESCDSTIKPDKLAKWFKKQKGVKEAFVILKKNEK